MDGTLETLDAPGIVEMGEMHEIRGMCEASRIRKTIAKLGDVGMLGTLGLLG